MIIGVDVLMPKTCLHIAFAIVIVAVLGVPKCDAQDKINFAKQILPILSDKCFLCHGPDGGKGETDLRLDSFEGATAGGAVDPGEPDDSEMILRIFDEDDPMPPEESKPLSDVEKELLKRWVKEGGQYTQHWAYVLPQKQTGSIDDWINKSFPENVDFAPQADRATLARRAALILTGLPPEPDELTAFLDDKSEDAYETYLDQLMASTRYGEHQARYWLDAVRYGDTHGLHLDNRRGIFPYRDWVIRSFNSNQPFDQFITWQLAGDLLPDPTMEQLVATGFVRMNPSTAEGGVIPAEFQAKNNFDRVETLGVALLGTSFVCARCHTHKYDPITHTEYYELLAFFNNTAESPLDGNAYQYGPILKVPANIKAWDNWTQLEKERDQLLKGLDKNIANAAVELAKSLGHWKSSNWKATKPIASTGERPEEKQWENIDRLPGKNGDLPGKTDQARWVSFEVEVGSKQNLALTFNSGPGPELFLNGQPEPLQGNLASLTLEPGTTKVELKLIGSKRLPLQVELSSLWDALREKKNWDSLAPQQQISLLADSGGELVDESKTKQAAELNKKIESAQAQFTTTLIAKELPKPRVTKLLERGEYDIPQGEPLNPDVPETMGAMSDELPRNRLGLARWLTDADHPLVTRVLVNRFWQQVFGVALVRTPEEFGLQGDHPTHPELLDTLAVEFHQSGWDLKKLFKRMLTSRTFCQQSKWRPDLSDPENKIYARGPGYRLDAEVIRDTALWASGLLDSEMGGEGVKPWQPEGMWSALMHPRSNTKKYVADQDGREFRRSIYVYWKRTSPHPMMTLFDAPNRESSCVRRSRSTTPLQSLGLLNESQRIAAAKALAQRLIAGGEEDQARLDQLFLLLASRKPTDSEKEVCLSLLESSREKFSKNLDDATALVGQDVNDEAEVASWTQLCVTVMASDIAIRLN